MVNLYSWAIQSQIFVKMVKILKLLQKKKINNNCKLIFKSKNYYDKKTQTLFSPGIYEFYDNKGCLLQKEEIDFQIHLYKYGEMDRYLKEIGFKNIKIYLSFNKDLTINDKSEFLLCECSI